MEHSPVLILIAAVLTNNIVFSGFLGMCSFIALSRRIDTAVGMGFAVTFVSTFTTALNWLIYHYVLKHGALSGVSFLDGVNLEPFTMIVFIAVIASFVQVVELIIQRISHSLYQALGIFLPLITVNCAILGVSLFMVIRGYGFISSVAFGFGSGLGWMLAIVLMAGLRRKMRFSKIPPGLEGIGITMITTGILAMIFMVFNGMVRIN
ncbi:MAG: NADH:ubiquinone reductase (Na(+)-transporting) subunit E [Deltaproteobacteria bacterium]|nr:NADH:ubiquinone reductase (Na(+)-transporting) subunit E [Deltaproteobacteria bacterium]